LKKEKVEPPEMAVFSFIDLPGVLTHGKKGEHIMKKDKLTKEAQILDNKINELSKTTTRKLKKVRPEGSYQFHGNAPKPKVSETKKQKWILVNKQGKLSGILDHIAFDTRGKAKSWFQRTSDISGGTIKIDDHYYVLKSEEYEFLNELDVLDLIADQDIN